VTHDWTVLLRSEHGQILSVHYVPREEAERIARVAPALRASVVDGPRAMGERERTIPADRK
jgi:hypothetical protein